LPGDVSLAKNWQNFPRDMLPHWVTKQAQAEFKRPALGATLRTCCPPCRETSRGILARPCHRPGWLNPIRWTGPGENLRNRRCARSALGIPDSVLLALTSIFKACGVGLYPKQHSRKSGKTRGSTMTDRRTFAHGFCALVGTRLCRPKCRKMSWCTTGRFCTALVRAEVRVVSFFEIGGFCGRSGGQRGGTRRRFDGVCLVERGVVGL
jgi:hypothetical protein